MTTWTQSQRDDRWIYKHWPALWGVLAITSAVITGVVFGPNLLDHPYWYAWVLIPEAWAHEFEEYFIGNFWRWYNRTCFKSKEDFFPLTRERAFVINGSSAVPLVLQAVLISAFDFNALTVFLLLSLHANAWFHITYTVGEGRYSPGAVTSLLLYLPLTTYALYDLWIVTGAVTLPGLVIGLVVALAAGIGLFTYLRRTAQREPERLYPIYW
ncbi:MAG: HXXEE domain-containing protein [Anaerolineae bacterium]